MGRAVVGYDIRGMREVVDPALGTLVPRGDQAALTSVVEDLLADPDRRRAVGARLRDRVTARFSETGVIERLGAVYDAVGVRR